MLVDKSKRHKARLMAIGFTQQSIVHYNEGAVVKFSFLNSYIEEEVYVDQPQGYEIQSHKGKLYKLKKALYGLKQCI